MKGGYDGAMQLCQLEQLPDCLFCASDAVAIGALKTFHEKNIHIPEQMEIISVGNGQPDMAEYCVPSLSIIKLPMKEMAGACLDKIFESINSFNYTVSSKTIPVQYIGRESCPEQPEA